MNESGVPLEDIDHEFEVEREWAQARPNQYYPAEAYKGILTGALRNIYAQDKPNVVERLMDKVGEALSRTGYRGI